MTNGVRVKIDNEIKQIAKLSLLKFNNKSEFCKYFKVSWKTYRNWFWKDCGTIPFEFIESACKLNEIKVWDFLDGKEILGKTGGRGGRSRLIFNKNAFSKLSNFLGWVLSDGHVNKNGRRINISQKEIVVLNEILRDLNKLNLLEKVPSIKLNKDIFFFEINSSPFTFIITKYLNLPMGKRTSFSIPEIILKGSRNEWFGFIAGIFEGDGTFTDQDGRPIIHLEMNDYRFVNDLRNMLTNLGFNPTKIFQHRNNFSFSMTRKNEVSRFIEKIRPFIKHPKVSEFLVEYGGAS